MSTRSRPRAARSRPSRRVVWRRRAPWLAAGAVLALVAAGAVVAMLLRDGGPERIGRDGSTEMTDGAPVTIERVPDAWRIVYRLEEQSGDDVRVSTDRFEVRRPFESRFETWDGAPPGDDVVTTRIAAFARFATREPGQDGGDAAFVVPPRPSPHDVRLDAALDAALDAGLIERRERREVAGRPCQVYRTFQGLGGPLRLPEDEQLEHVDSCVDEAGLLLEEVRVVDGAAIQRRLAVEVEEEPTLGDERFETGTQDIPVREGGGQVREMVPDSRPPGPFYELSEPPAGYRKVGRFSVVPPQPENFSDPLRIAFRRAGVSDVWVRGVDVIVVDQGGTLQGEAPFEVDPDNPTVEIEGLGTAEVIVAGSASEVRVLLSGGRYVQAYGTVAPEELADLLRRLVEVEGGTLEFLD